MKKNLHIALICAISALAGCSSGSDEPEAQPTPVSVQYPMAFGTSSAEEPASRANTPLEAEYSEFGVWATKTVGTETTDVMSHSDATAYITWYGDTSNEWYYDQALGSYPQYLKYWDLSADSYLFSAYVPYYFDRDHNTYYTHSLFSITHTPNGVSIPNIAGNIASDQQPYWLVATTYRQVTGQNSTAASEKETVLISDYDLYADQSMASPMANATYLTDEVPLVFHPLLSVVEFRLYNEGSSTLLNNVLITIQDDDGGVWATGSFEGNAYAFSTKEATVLSTQPNVQMDKDGAYSTRDNALVLGELHELPQGLEGKSLRAVFTVTSGDLVYEGEIEGQTPEWVAGNKYIYIFKMNIAGSDPSSDTILVDIQVEPYKYGGEVVHDPVTNW